MTVWPQYTMLGLLVFALLTNLYFDGKRNRGAYQVIASVLAFILPVTLLYFGGFWSVIGFAP